MTHSSEKSSVDARGPDVSVVDQSRHDRAAGWSLRLRLMLTLLAVFGTIQVSMTMLWIRSVDRSTDKIFEQMLTSHARDIADELARAGGRPTESSIRQAADNSSRSSWCGRVYVTVFDESGQVLGGTNSPPLPYIAPSVEGPEFTVLPITIPRAAPSSGADVRARAVAIAFEPEAGGRYIAVVAAGDAFPGTIASGVTQPLIWATPIGLAAAALAGWLIAGLAVRPIERLGQIARSIRPDTLQSPIELGSSASELTKLQVALDDMRRRLERGYEAQERFVANVSHEFKTPIATVLTEAQTLASKHELPNEARRFIESTEDEMRRLGKLVESFLVLTRVRHGKPLHTTMRTVGVNDLVMESMMHCWKTAEQYSVRLLPELAMEEERELSVHGDPELLRTMIDNLVRNAVRFSPRGDTVLVRVESGPDTATICVRDHGPTIPEELVATLFDRFSVGKAEEKLGRGSGLGLEIAQGIAELHRGSIAVRNDAGACEFNVTLPLVPITPEQAERSRASLFRNQLVN